MTNIGKSRWDGRAKRFYVDLHLNGKRDRLYHLPTRHGLVPCKTREVAEILLGDIQTDIHRGTFRPENFKKTKAIFLKDYFESWIGEHRASAGTIHDYRNSFKNHIIPVLGDRYLPQIGYKDLKALQNGIKRAPKGKYNTMGALHAMMKEACREGYFTHMPEWPVLSGDDEVIPPPVDWLTQEDQWRVIDKIPPDDRYIFLFHMGTGCRSSEARAFRKQDIYWDKNYIEFAVTFGLGEELKPVKGKRVVPWPMTDFVRSVLESVAVAQSEFVFLNPRTKKPYTRKSTDGVWERALKAAGCRYVPLNKSMRHSFACNLLNAGIDKSVVQRLLRHTDIKITDRYTEYLTEPLKVAVDNVINLPERWSTINSTPRMDKQ